MSSTRRRNGRHALHLGVLGLLAIGLAAGCATSQPDDQPRMGRHHGRGRGQGRRAEQVARFTAFAINLGSRGNLPSGQAGTVEIRIDRWSTPNERQGLLAALRDGGSDGLLKALQDTRPVGTIRTPDHLGLDLHYAMQHVADDGSRRIFLATDRRIGFWEAANQALSVNYPFTLIELHLDRDGKGEGKMSIATKVTESVDKDHIELENYTSEPVRLQDVREQKGRE